MIDEIITFFLAGSFTLKTTNSNLLMYLDIYPQAYNKLMKELKDTVFPAEKPIDTRAALTIESIEQLRYFSYCFYESLRLEAPTVGSMGIFNEDNQSVLGVTLRKGDLFLINMQAMHYDPTEW
jgi:cytochrome P450